MEQQRNQNIIGRNPVPLQRIGDFGVLARRRSRKHVQSKATRYRGVSDSSKHADLSLNSSSRYFHHGHRRLVGGSFLRGALCMFEGQAVSNINSS